MIKGSETASPPCFPTQEETWPASPLPHRRCTIIASWWTSNGGATDSSTHRDHCHDGQMSERPHDGIRR